mgnify:CR=1 FL=1
MAKLFEITSVSARTNALKYHEQSLENIMREIQKASSEGKVFINLPQTTPEIILNYLTNIGYIVFEMVYINYKWYKVLWLQLK